MPLFKKLFILAIFLLGFNITNAATATPSKATNTADIEKSILDAS